MPRTHVAPATTVSAAPSSAALRKWKRWLDRIYSDQLSGLLVNQHIFKQVAEAVAPYEGTEQAADLAVWMREGYIALAAITVRRMLEEPARPPAPKRCPKCGHETIPKPKADDSISLIGLLRDVEQYAPLFTRAWFRLRFTSRNPHMDKKPRIKFADRDFNRVTRNKRAPCLPPGRVRRDVIALQRMARPVRRLVNKAIAHTERDRRKVGRPTLKQLDAAITALADTYHLYSLLIVGSCSRPLVPLDSFDVSSDLKKIWF